LNQQNAVYEMVAIVQASWLIAGGFNKLKIIDGA
jgi:hypothetical protein